MAYQRLEIADCLEYMPSLPPGYFDLVVTDPPYNISGGSKVQKRYGKIQNADYGDWDKMEEQEYDAFIEKVFKEYERLLKVGGSAYVWLDRAYIGVAWRIAKKVGLTPKNIITCVKRNPVPGILSRRNWRSGFETALYMTKGSAKTFNFLSQEKMVNVLYYNIGQHETEHPTEKPVELIKHFIEVSSNDDEMVLDSFAGSGAVLEACRMTNRSCIGIELDPIWKEVIEKKALLKQGSLDLDACWKSVVATDTAQSKLALDIPESPVAKKDKKEKKSSSDKGKNWSLTDLLRKRDIT